MVKVSVVIPIYGVERFIERCARSLFEQTLDDIEFIFVDDCTRDNSIAILLDVLEQYPNRKKQFHLVHHKENKGLPQARKTGMKYVSGDYVIHCDSDDWVDPNMYAMMYNKAVSEDADIVISDYFQSDGLHHEAVELGSIPSSKEELIINLLCHKLQPAVWNKLVRKSCYTHNIEFSTNNMAEDLALMVQLFYFCSRVTYLKCQLYYYYCNNFSITGSRSFESVLKRVFQYRENVCFIEKFFLQENKIKIYKNGINHLKFSVKNELCHSEYDQRIHEVWKSLFPELGIIDVIHLKKSTVKAKLLYITSYLDIYSYYNRYIK